MPAVDDPDDTPEDLVRPVYEYRYDHFGNQISIKDPLHVDGSVFRQTVLGYDTLGRQISRQMPLHGVNGDFEEIMEYDNRGRQDVSISFEGEYTVTKYDDRTGRITETWFFNDEATYNEGLGTPDDVRSYQYDDYGRQIGSELRVNGALRRSETMTYDDRGRQESVTNDEGTIMYLYDNVGRQTEVRSTTAWENITTYEYDELGRLKNVQSHRRSNADIADDITSYAYDLFGNLDATIYANDLVHDYRYDDLNRLTELHHFVDNNDDLIFNAPDVSRASFVYTLRADGKRTDSTDTFDGVETVNYVWDYDAAGRLISETATGSSFDHYTTTFTYDLTGNRKEEHKVYTEGMLPEEKTSYLYNENDQLIDESKVVGGSDLTRTEYYYGENFNSTRLTTKAVSFNNVPQPTQEFEYNLQGRLSKVTTLDDMQEVVESSEYRYDSQGNRIWSRHEKDNVVTETEFLTDSQNHTGYSQVLVETKTVDGEPSERIVYTFGHDQISQAIFTYDGDWNASETHYFGTDGHGSVRVLYDLAAAIVQSSVAQIFHFDAYGNLLNFTGAVVPLTTYLYSGEAFDFNIGQQYLRARWYDPATGRFNRLDPFFGNLNDPQSLHKYAYVHGDPIQNIDPSGEITLAGLTTSITNIGGRISARLSSAYRVYRFAENVVDLISVIDLVRGLTTGIPALQRELSRLIEDVGDLGNRAARFSSISGQDIVDAFAQIASDLPLQIAPTIARTHGARVTDALISRSQPFSRRDVLVFYAPTPFGRFFPDKHLIRVPGLEIANMKVNIGIGGGGGRLFGVGVAKAKKLRKSKNDSYMLFRLDWHQSSIQHPLPHAKYFETRSGFDLHWQIPENAKDARSTRDA